MITTLHPMHRDAASATLRALAYVFPSLLSKTTESAMEAAIRLARWYIFPDRSLPGCYEVQSQNQKNVAFTVDALNRSCNCLASKNGVICEHRLVVAIHIHGPDAMYTLQKMVYRTKEITQEECQDILEGR